jgi:hypothetical protein
MDDDDCETRFEILDLLHKLILVVLFVYLRIDADGHWLWRSSILEVWLWLS